MLCAIGKKTKKWRFGEDTSLFKGKKMLHVVRENNATRALKMVNLSREVDFVR
jgi:hypothetical protein